MLRRYAPMKPSRGTVIPAAVRQAVYNRDGGCLGPRVEMPGDCFGQLELDHIRASHGMGMKSASDDPSNLALLCSTHHKYRTEHGREWRPRLLAYIATNGGTR